MLVNNYAGSWVTSSNIYHLLTSQFTQAKNNIHALYNPSNPEEGGEGCFSNPDRCDQIYDELQKNIKPLQIDSIQQQL